MASRLVRQSLVGVGLVLSSQARRLALVVPLSIQVYKWLLANLTILWRGF